MTVAHTESIRNVLGVHAIALQSPRPQTAAVDSDRFVGSNWQQANGSCIPHPSFLGLCGWHDGVLAASRDSHPVVHTKDGGAGTAGQWTGTDIGKFADAPALRGNAAINIRLTEVPTIRKSSAPGRRRARCLQKAGNRFGYCGSGLLSRWQLPRATNRAPRGAP